MTKTRVSTIWVIFRFIECNLGKSTRRYAAVRFYLTGREARVKMDTVQALNVFAVNYDGNFISQVQAVGDTKNGSKKYFELTRQQLIGGLGRGVVMNTVGGDPSSLNDWGRISLIDILGTKYFTLNDQNVGLDDLGDLPGY